MRIIEYFAQSEAEREYWTGEIEKGDWVAAKFLARQLAAGTLHKRYGACARLLLGLEGERLAAFCTYADRDEIDCPETPWIGFVYTFPAYRGRRRSEELIEHACALAKAEGFDRVYLSSSETGLYEKYGFAFLKVMRDVWDKETKVYCREL